jgi:C4-dicarboxylate-specific signal transduction histidine kinase
MQNSDQFTRALRTVLSCTVAITSVTAAVVVTLGLGPAMKHTPTLFFCSVMVSSWFGGIWSGILAGLLSWFALDYYFIPPLHAFGIGSEEAPDMIVFAASALFVSWLNGEQKRAKVSLRRARDELDAKVEDRTAELKQTNEQLQAEIAERKVAEEALVGVRAEMARAARITTMGELAASIAHQVNQPLAAVVINGNACARLLGAHPPNLDEARRGLESIIRDATRASNVIVGVRGLLMKGERVRERLDINEVIGEVIAVAQGELLRHSVSVGTDLVDGLPAIIGDRVQLQQVLLNLIMNAIEAMNTDDPGSRVLHIRTHKQEPDSVGVAVRDSGVGLCPEHFHRIFEAFFTTKSEGIGMGLTISRSIIEAHGGRLSATANSGPGITVRFTLPTESGGRM